MGNIKSASVGLAGLICLSTSGFAWHKPGHMITALIAYENLDPATRSQLAALLKDHPRFAQDFQPVPAGFSQEDKEKWLFCQASIWPDHVRPFPGGHDGTIPADPQTRTSYHREHWHFINYPIGLLPAGATDDEIKALELSGATNINLSTNVPAQETLKINVLQAIEFNAAILKDNHASHEPGGGSMLAAPYGRRYSSATPQQRTLYTDAVLACHPRRWRPRR